MPAEVDAEGLEGGPPAPLGGVASEVTAKAEISTDPEVAETFSGRKSAVEPGTAAMRVDGEGFGAS